MVKGIKTAIKNKYAGKVRYNNLWEYLFKISLMGMNIGGGDIPELSGETNLLRILSYEIDTTEPVLFDVGANVGKYTVLLKKHFPNSMVYCFEPSARTYDILHSNITQYEGVQAENIGLGENDGEATLFYDYEGSGIASLYNRHLEQYEIHLNATEKVKIMTLDGYCIRNGITHIDFLKLDVEGNEYSVLKSANNMLDGNIDFIQIEFGGTYIDSRVFFRDFWELLSDKYDVYRIMKDGIVNIEGYSEMLEVFCCTNYLFASKEKKRGV